MPNPTPEPPRRPPVPDHLARWQPADELAAAIAATGLAETPAATGNVYAGWVPLQPPLEEAMTRARTYPAQAVPVEWRLRQWAVRGERPRADVYLTLEGRAQSGETVAVQLRARTAA